MSIRNLKVVPVTFRNEVVGFRVGGITRDCPDSLWDPIAHRAVFRTRERAEAFLARVCNVAPWSLNLKEWLTGYSWDGVYSVL
jgi:hypothetical protein